MMDKTFILNTMQVAEYRLKETTKSSYYWQSGTKLLPNRISLSIGVEITKVQRKGRNLLNPIIGQMLGTFSSKDESTLKQYKPYCCRTQIWFNPDYPLLAGYGTIGVTAEDGKIKDTGDLIVLKSYDDWNTISIYIFKGCGNPDNMDIAMECANDVARRIAEK